MGAYLDADSIRAHKEQTARDRQDCIDWVAGALGEFRDAFVTVDTKWTGVRTSPYGILDLVKTNAQAGSGEGSP